MFQQCALMGLVDVAERLLQVPDAHREAQAARCMRGKVMCIGTTDYSGPERKIDLLPGSLRSMILVFMSKPPLPSRLCTCVCIHICICT